MNREDILSMEAGEELDSIIAEKVMGWSYINNFAFSQITAEEPMVRYCSSTLRLKEEVTISSPFHPSRDIASAWEVVNKLHPENSFGNDTFEISMFRYKDGRAGWVAAFAGVDKIDNYAIAPTAPLAISIAALISVMEL